MRPPLQRKRLIPRVEKLRPERRHGAEERVVLGAGEVVVGGDEIALGQQVAQLEPEVRKGAAHTPHELGKRLRALDLDEMVKAERRRQLLPSEALVVRELREIAFRERPVPGRHRAHCRVLERR